MSNQQHTDSRAGDIQNPSPAKEDKALEEHLDEQADQSQSSNSPHSASGPALSSDDQNKALYLETGDMEQIRKEQREKAYGTLCSLIPELINRLNILVGNVNDVILMDKLDKASQDGLQGYASAAESTQIGKQLKQLTDSGLSFIREQDELLKADEAAFSGQLQSRSDRLQRLASDAEALGELCKKLHPESDAAREGRKALEKVNLIISHPLFDDVQPIEPSQNQWVTSSGNLRTGSTAKLIQSVQAEMRKMLDYCSTLKQWLFLWKPLPLNMDENQKKIHDKGLSSIRDIECFCKSHLKSCEYDTKEPVMRLKAKEDPLCFEKLEALMSYEIGVCVTWIDYANELVNLSVTVTTLLLKNLPAYNKECRQETVQAQLYS